MSPHPHPLVNLLMEAGVTERRAVAFDTKLLEHWHVGLGPDELARRIEMIVKRRTYLLTQRVDRLQTLYDTWVLSASRTEDSKPPQA